MKNINAINRYHTITNDKYDVLFGRHFSSVRILEDPENVEPKNENVNYLITDPFAPFCTVTCLQRVFNLLCWTLSILVECPK